MVQCDQAKAFKIRQCFHFVTSTLDSVARKYLREFPENQVKIPIQFPTQMKFPHYGEKVGFIAFLLTNFLVLAINMSKFMKHGQVYKNQ